MKPSFVFAPHIQGGKRSTEEFVKKQCESDLDEIFSLNSIFLFSYFMINHFKKIFSNFLSIPEINASANLVTLECVNIASSEQSLFPIRSRA